MKAIYSIVGVQYREAADFVASLPSGEPLKLVREPDNAFDQNAVQVWAQDRHIGFISAKQAKPLARKMDEAKTDFVGKLIPGNYPEVEVSE